MLYAQRRPERIVVELTEFGTPPDEHLKTIGQKNPDHHPQSGRPGLDRADRRVGPVHGSHERSHLASTRKAVAIRGRYRFNLRDWLRRTADAVSKGGIGTFL